MGSEYRRSPRQRTCKVGHVLREDGSTLAKCVLIDMSTYGAQLHFSRSAAEPVPDRFMLKLAVSDLTRAVRVVRRMGDRLGVEFV